MKTEIRKIKNEFKPFELVIKIESEEDLDNLYEFVFNMNFDRLNQIIKEEGKIFNFDEIDKLLESICTDLELIKKAKK